MPITFFHLLSNAAHIFRLFTTKVYLQSHILQHQSELLTFQLQQLRISDLQKIRSVEVEIVIVDCEK